MLALLGSYYASILGWPNMPAYYAFYNFRIIDGGLLYFTRIKLGLFLRVLITTSVRITS